MQNNEMSAGTNAEQSTNVDDTNVSQTIAKPNVGRSFNQDMTVSQFLYEKYLGKKISFVVREYKESDDKIYGREVSPMQEKPIYFENWEERQFAKVDKKSGQPFWFRDVECIEKVIEIKQSYNYWNLKTMSGFKIRLYAHSELGTVE